jgi:lipopolysaccharide transport system permease protein
MHTHPTNPWRKLIDRRHILLSTTIVEIRRRYAGSVLGMIWLLLGPAVFMSMYILVYGVVFKLKPEGMSQTGYLLYVLSGLVAFLGVSEALNTGTTSLAIQKDILLNTIFPAELVPLRAVIVALAPPIVGLLFLLAADLVLASFTIWNFLVPLVLFLLFMFVMGVVWLLSLANLVVKDVQYVISYATMLLLVASPIAFTPNMVPPQLSWVIWLNPLSYFVSAIQTLVVYDSSPTIGIWLGCIGLGITSFAFGWTVFQRAKAVFIDYA